MNYADLARAEALRQGVDPALALAVMGQESGGRPDAVSPKGATGLFQLMGPTAAELGVDPSIPEQNIRGGIQYLGQQLNRFGSPELALAAYNAGPGAVQRHGGIPPYPETQKYVRNVMARAGGDTDIFGTAQARPQAPTDDSDIFADRKPPAAPQAAGGAQDDSDIFADRPKVERPPAPTQDAEKPPAGKTGAVYNAAAGINESLARTIGGPVDIVNWGLEKLGVPVSGKPVMGSDWLKDRMGDIGADPRNIQAADATERAIRGGARGVTDALSIALPAGAAANAARVGGMAEGVASSLAAQPVTQAVAGGIGGAVGEATDNPLLGAAAAFTAPILAHGATRVVSPIRSQLNPEEARLAAAAANEGIRLTPAQQSGSRPLQTMESVFNSLPITSGPQKAVQQAQRDQFNRAVLSRAGVDANAATPEVLDNAFRRLGTQFEDISARTTVPLDNTFLGDLQNVVGDYSRKLPSQQREVFTNYVDDILNSGNVMDGGRYQVTRSDLTRQAKSLTNSDPTLSRALRGLRDALDNAANRAIPQADQDAWEAARREYANLKTISKAVGTATDGNIPPAQLASALRRDIGTDQYARGGGELNNLARIGNAFVRQQIPNSGTAERAGMTSLLTGGPIGAGVGATMAGADPMMSMGVGLLGAALPRAVQAAYNSPAGRWWLTNQLAAHAGPTVNTGLLGAILANESRGLLPSR